MPLLLLLALVAGPTRVAVWTASSHGPYPLGNAVAQPDLTGVLAATGAEDQTFRLIVKPDMSGRGARLRFSNVFGTQPVTLDGVFVGLHASGGSIVAGTNLPVKFVGGRSVRIDAGKLAYSDEVDLRFGGRDLVGRKLAVSFHVAGAPGPMTWHAKALTTSYLSAPHSGSHGGEDSSKAFPFTTTSWYFLDAIDLLAPCGTSTVVAFGDSITDGTASTINGDDRWPDFFSQRLHAKYGSAWSVVQTGIGGNRVVSNAGAGGPSALERLDRDVLSLPNVKIVIWLEGINDITTGASTAEAVIEGLREGVSRMHARGIKVIGATVTSNFKSTPNGTPEVDAKRRAINEFIRNGKVFDGVADFDVATLDTETGTLRAAYIPNSSIGGAGDKLHPNRAGYQAMANAIDLSAFTPSPHACAQSAVGPSR